MPVEPDRTSAERASEPGALLIFCILLLAVFCLVLFTYLIFFGGNQRG